MDNINFNELTQKYSFFSKDEIPWHKKGQIVSDYLTSSEALEAAGLAFTVELRPNIHRLDNGTEIKSENSFFTYRTDTNQVLGDKIGKDYRVVQNREAFEFFDAIVGGEGGIMYETAGALGKGERIFITAKLPNYIRVGKEDVIEKYLFLTTSHDGNGCILAAFTPIRIVCNNTLNAALRNCAKTVKIRHTQNAKERLQQAHKVMEMTNTLTVQMEGIFNEMAKVRITDREVKRLIQLALASNETLDKLKKGEVGKISTHFNNTVDQAYAFAMGNTTQLMDSTAGTLFGAFNAVTGYYQNVRSYKSDDSKMNAFYYGGVTERATQSAFNLCEAFLKHGSSALMLN